MLCASAAVYVVHSGWGKHGASRSLVDRAAVAAVLLGLGFAFKVYPAIFVLPLMLYVLTGGRRRPSSAVAGADWRGAVGWRRLDRHGGADERAVRVPASRAGRRRSRSSCAGGRTSPRTRSGSGGSAAQPGQRDGAGRSWGCCRRAGSWSRSRWRAGSAGGVTSGGPYPWVPVSAAMLCGFLLLHKVHSPQYTLWLVPMFVLLRVNVGLGGGVPRWLTRHGRRHLPVVLRDQFGGKRAESYDGFTGPGRDDRRLGLGGPALGACSSLPALRGHLHGNA